MYLLAQKLSQTLVAGIHNNFLAVLARWGSSHAWPFHHTSGTLSANVAQTACCWLRKRWSILYVDPDQVTTSWMRAFCDKLRAVCFSVSPSFSSSSVRSLGPDDDKPSVLFQLRDLNSGSNCNWSIQTKDLGIVQRLWSRCLHYLWLWPSSTTEWKCGFKVECSWYHVIYVSKHLWHCWLKACLSFP